MSERHHGMDRAFQYLCLVWITKYRKALRRQCYWDITFEPEVTPVAAGNVTDGVVKATSWELARLLPHNANISPGA